MGLVPITVRLPKEICDKASDILSVLGLTMEDALIMFLEETVRPECIPFDYTEEDLAEVQRWEKMMDDGLYDV